jgi:hypothetical protein
MLEIVLDHPILFAGQLVGLPVDVDILPVLMLNQRLPSVALNVAVLFHKVCVPIIIPLDVELPI